MTSSTISFTVKRKYCGKLNVSYEGNVQSTIVKRYLKKVLTMKMSRPLENPGKHFISKLSANKRFGTYTVYNRQVGILNLFREVL